jgi:hypothetical protein
LALLKDLLKYCLLGSTFHRRSRAQPGTRRATHPCPVRKALSEVKQERPPRCGNDRRGGGATETCALFTSRPRTSLIFRCFIAYATGSCIAAPHFTGMPTPQAHDAERQRVNRTGVKKMNVSADPATSFPAARSTLAPRHDMPANSSLCFSNLSASSWCPSQETSRDVGVVLHRYSLSPRPNRVLWFGEAQSDSAIAGLTSPAACSVARR